MANPLTLVQVIGIATGSWLMPMHASSLLKLFGTAGKPLSLLSVRDKLQGRNNIVILQLRDLSVVNGVSNLAGLEANWNALDPAFVPTQAALTNFVNFLNKYGVSVVKISQDWRTAAISGTTLSYASIPAGYIVLPQNAAAQSSGGLKPQGGGDGQAGVGGGLVFGGATAAGGAGWSLLPGGASAGSAATGPLGPWAIGWGGAGAGAQAEAAAGAAGALSGGVGWVVLVVGIAAVAVGGYLWATADSTSSGSTGSGSGSGGGTGTGSGSGEGTGSGSGGGSSQNDPSQGFQTGDGTQVYGTASPSDADAIATALNGAASIDPSDIPSDPPSAPIDPGGVDPTDPWGAPVVDPPPVDVG